MATRKIVKLSSWPDPLVQERLEDEGFFFDKPQNAWMRFCAEDEVTHFAAYLNRHHLTHQVLPAMGAGELKRHPRLSDALILKNGGGPAACALCGARNVPCRQWIEGDDCDSIEYAHAARFYLCGKCVQTRMQAHPRLYVAADDHL